MVIDSIDVLLEKLRRAIVPGEQFELLKKLQEEFYKEEPVLFLIARSDMIGTHRDLDLYLINERPGYALFQPKWTTLHGSKNCATGFGYCSAESVCGVFG